MTETAAAVTGDARRRRIRTFAILFASAIAIVVVALAVRGTADFDATADGAAISLATIDAIKRVVLLGPYSQYGWHHPGPLLFYLLAPIYRLSGYHEMALRWMALLLNAAAIGWTVALLRRHAGVLLSGLVAVAACAMVLRAGGDFPFSVWNPLVTVFPLGLLVVLNALAMSERVSVLPWSALVSSFLIQTDIAYTPVVIAIGAACVAGAGLHAWKHPGVQRTSLWRAIHRAAWVLVAVWLFPVAEELVHRPAGNLDLIAHYFQRPAEVQHSFWQAFGFFSHAYVGVAASSFVSALGHTATGPFPRWESAAAIALLAGGVALVWIRRASRFERALYTLCSAAACTAAWSATRIPVQFMDYQLFWISIVGAITLAGIAGVVLAPMRRPGRRAGALVQVGVAAVLLLTVAVTYGRVQAWQRDASRNQRLSQLHEDLERYAAAHGIDRPVLYHTGATWADTTGLILLCAKHGDAIAANDDLIDIVGAHYRAGAGDVHCVGVYDAGRDAAQIAQGREFARRGPLVLAAIGGTGGCQLPR